MSSLLTQLGQKTKVELDKKLALAGGTMTGALTLSGAPTDSLHAATKAYVDSVSSTASGLQTELDATQAGSGLGAALSRGDGRLWAIPLGIVGGSMVGCQVDGG